MRDFDRSVSVTILERVHSLERVRPRNMRGPGACVVLLSLSGRPSFRGRNRFVSAFGSPLREEVRPVINLVTSHRLPVGTLRICGTEQRETATGRSRCSVALRVPFPRLPNDGNIHRWTCTRSARAPPYRRSGRVSNMRLPHPIHKDLDTRRFYMYIKSTYKYTFEDRLWLYR